MQKKIVFFDIDGTIYHYQKGVIEDSKNAIRRLRQNGHLAFLCTGRTKPMITPDILAIGFDGIVAGGGTYVEYNGQQLSRVDLEDNVAWEVIESMRRHGVMPVPEGHDYIYFEEEDKIVDNYRKAYQIYQTSIPNQIQTIEYGNVHVAKISGAFGVDSNIEEIRRELSDRFLFVNHNNELLELIPKGHSKAQGIQKVLEQLQIPVENTYAFGDSFNDLEMLTYVHHGIAMGNSDPELFQHVKYRTSGFEEGGIREGLVRFRLIEAEAE